MEGAYLQGLKHGEWKIFDRQGKLLSVINYTYGIADNQDELIDQETKTLDIMIKNVGRIQEPSIEEFIRGQGY